MRQLRSTALRAFVMAVASGLVPTTTLAQATDTPGAPLRDPLPGWVTNWSPLQRVADLARQLPAGSRFPDLLTFPDPRVGIFWTVGNPGALPLEVADERVEFRFELEGSSGDYFRPLDPGGVSRGELSTLGWRRLGERGAVIGSAVFDRTSFQDSVFADVLVPYSSNPFVVIDTIGDPMRRTAVQLEGATGWRFGRLGLGASLGWEGQSNRTVASPVPRLDRTASTGVVGGASLELGGGFRLGIHGRLRETAEFIQIRTISQPSRIFQLEGYEEPIPLDLQPATYERRFERTAYAVGGAIGFPVLGGAGVLFAQREDVEEEQFIRQNDAGAPKDVWAADGWTLGGAVQWADADRWVLTLDGRYTTLEGDAFRADIGGIVFTVDEQRLQVDMNVRLRLGAGWRAGGRVELRRATHDRRDLLAEATSDIRSWQGGGAIELARVFANRLGVSIGGRFASYSPSGEIPDPSSRGPVYRRFVGPHLALELAQAVTAAGTIAARWQVADATGLWLRGEYGSLDPTDESIPLLPDGTRQAWRMSAGVVLHEGWP
jgi:hypothetical protein